MTEPVLFEVSARIATITLNRPEKMNAINFAMADALLALLDKLEVDNRVGAIIITGATAMIGSLYKWLTTPLEDHH